jgi:hypothetical protein
VHGHYPLASPRGLRDHTLQTQLLSPLLHPFRLFGGSMLESRRHLIQSFATFTGIIAVVPTILSAQRPSPQPLPSPNAPNPAYPQGMNGPGPTQPDQKAIDKQNQAQIRSDVERLYALVSDLRQEVSLTNSANVLSLSVVKKAKEIEKIAKQVKDLARG